MAGEIAAAGAGLQAPGLGSTTNDVQGALAAFLSGAKAERELKEKKALEQAKLAIDQQNADTARIGADAQTTMAGAQLIQAQTGVRAENRAQDLLPAQIEAYRAQADNYRSSTATAMADLMDPVAAVDAMASELTEVYQVPRGVVDKYRRSPRMMRELLDRTKSERIASIQGGSQVAVPTMQALLGLTDRTTAAMADVQNMEAQRDAAIANMMALENMAAVEDPNTGETVRVIQLVQEKGIAYARSVVEASPEIQAMNARLEQSQAYLQSMMDMREEVVGSLKGFLGASMETAAGAAQGAIDGEVARSGGEPGGPNVNPPPPLDSQTIETVRAVMISGNVVGFSEMVGFLEKSYPGASAQLAQAGIDVEGAQRAMDARMDSAFQAANQYMQSYVTNDSLPADVLVQSMVNTLTVSGGAKFARGIGELSDTTATPEILARQLLGQAKELAAKGITPEDVESQLPTAALNSHLWSIVVDRWPKRIAPLDVGR